MRVLLKKELTSILCSPVSLFFILAFLLTCGFMNWFFPGNFNILNNGYANLNNFFELAPILLLVFIPALTMRAFSEEKRSGNLAVFRAYPKKMSSLFISKLIASWGILLLTLLASSIYVYSIYTLSVPVGNIDVHEILASYFSLTMLSLVFIAIGLFSSSLTNNQIVAFITALSINFLVFYGFDLIASVFSSGKTQLAISSIGLFSHYKLMGKGVIESSDLLILFNYIFLFSIISIFILEHKNNRTKRNLIISLIILFIINILCVFIPNHRWDFTSDKRYTISNYSKKLVEETDNSKKNIHFSIYLEGDMNSGFQRIRESINDLLTDFKRYSKNQITYDFVNPYTFGNNQEEVFEYMFQQGMQGIVLNETDREGKTSRKTIYPYAQAVCDGDTIQINLLKNIAGYSAEENLNASVENLEFEFIDAVRLFSKNEPEAIAFIEGHNELSRPYVYDAEELLSKYYFVNRGEIMNDISVLDDFKVIVIAGSTDKFSENEKFILDQYIMNGGRILWLLDGVFLSWDELQNSSQTPSMKNETNLDDLLFTYGVRINPVLLQDAQCTSILLSTGDQGAGRYTELPWYYSMLLLPSIKHPVTKDISLVKASFGSSIDIINQSSEVKKEVLLTTSPYSHIVPVPEMINFDVSEIQSDPDYFNQSFIPVSVALEGTFNSAFVNRMLPEKIEMHSRRPLEKSINTKMIFVSASDVIKNELIGNGQYTQALPMGYDRVSDKQYGNRDFIVNAVNWLANDDEWLSLRSKQQQIRLLNRQQAYAERNIYAIINIVSPILFVLILIGGFNLYRKRKYEK